MTLGGAEDGIKPACGGYKIIGIPARLTDYPDEDADGGGVSS
ncbi:hypothetical protein [Mastigocladopsis repens]|nr:hypothetical protein [Mastigocladopsis repens]